MSQALEVGKRLADLCKEGKFQEAADELYADDIVSIEAQGNDEMPARMEGLDAVRAKGEWWFSNNEIHSSTTEGPFVGHRDDQFVVRYEMDVTPKGGERITLREVALYTVRDGKVAQEEFLYLTE